MVKAKRGHKVTTKLKSATKVAKERRFQRKTGQGKSLNHISAEQFVQRHLYCITIHDIERQMDRDPEYAHVVASDPKRHKAHCDHPEDGWCGKEVTVEILQKVNDRLAFRAPEQQEVTINDLEVEVADNYDEGTVRGVSSRPNSETANGENKKFSIRIGGKPIDT